jgi:hypothetical protein
MKNPIRVDEFLFDWDEVRVVDFDYDYDLGSGKHLAKIWFKDDTDLTLFSENLKKTLKSKNIDVD